MSVAQRMMLFRECLRTVWNTYFRELDDGWHEFINVERSLFHGLVKVPLLDDNWAEVDLKILVHIKPQQTPCKLLRGRPEGNVVHWEEYETNHPDSTVLTFKDFFDWTNDGDFRDFDLLRCGVKESADRALVDREVLLEVYRAEFSMHTAGQHPAAPDEPSARR